MNKKTAYIKRLFAFLLAVALLPLAITVSAAELTPEPVLYSTADFRNDPLALEAVSAGNAVWLQGAAPNGADAFSVPVGRSSLRIGDFPTPHCDYYVWDMDISFSSGNTVNSGFISWNAATGGNTGLSLEVATNRSLHGRSGSSSSALSPAYSVNWGQWYHLEMMFLACIHFGDGDTVVNSIAQARIILTPYLESGELSSTSYRHDALPMRNFAGVIQYYSQLRESPTHIEVLPGTSIANLQVSQAWPDVINLSAPAASVSAGETLQLSYTASRKGFAAPPVSERSGERLVLLPVVNFELRDSEGAPLTSPMISVDASGKISVAASAPDMEILAVATCVTGAESNPVRITINALDAGMFEVLKFGVETRDGTADSALIRVGYVDIMKKFEFDNPVTFTVALFDDEGYLVGVSSSTVKQDLMPAGETTRVNLNLPLPENFDANTWTLKLFSWTGL